ncbi:cytochrome C biogenesis family protein [Orientia tsutsugamushi str. UT144]|uniref:Cytochrome c-type biogenesis protein n=1 Tax=Orientia tsutsugamushi str. UT144 TaxID=1441384 RepID=A0A0F3RJC8_ORITS|nr:cytochrome C biogenesis family protein [Orientia tsutsugamushi str. UT144]
MQKSYIIKLALFILLIFVVTVNNIKNRDNVNDISEFYKTIRCTVCNGQTIYDSNTNIAQKLREYIAMQNKQGKNFAEIRQDIIQNYGSEISITAESATIISVFLTKVVPWLFIAFSLAWIYLHFV